MSKTNNIIWLGCWVGLRAVFKQIARKATPGLGISLAMMIALFNFNSQAQAYTPPIGIPAPPFGIEQTIQNVYGSASYFTYYVDNTHPSATDTNNPKGSPTKPRLSIPSQLVAGDVVQIYGGPYKSSRDRFYFYGQGTSDKPIFITGAAGLSKVVLKQKAHFPDAQWIIFENFKIETTSGGVELRPMVEPTQIHHVSIRNCEIAGDGGFKSFEQFSAGAQRDLFPKSSISHIVFYRNISHDAGSYQSASEDDTSCFSIQHNCHYIWIIDNTGYKSGGDGVILAHNAAFTTDHIYIGRNTFYQNRENGIDLKQANDVIASQNVIFGHRPTGSSSEGGAIVVHYDTNRVWLLNNKIYDCDTGIMSTGSIDTHIIGNIIFNIHHTTQSYDPSSAYANGQAIHVRNSKRVYIANNTIFDCDAGIVTPGTTDTFSVFNNIVVGRSQADGYDIYIGNGESYVQINNNLFYGGAVSSKIRWNGRAFGVNEFKSASGQCSSCLEGTPLFLDAPKSFKLTAGSPAIDHGANYPSYSLFNQAYGLTIQKDFAEMARPQGIAYDIGAHEWIPSLDGGVAPLSPANLHIMSLN